MIPYTEANDLRSSVQMLRQQHASADAKFLAAHKLFAFIERMEGRAQPVDAMIDGNVITLHPDEMLVSAGAR